MSELKATTVYDAYWKANSVGEGTGILVYLKEDADKLIAELRGTIAQLEDDCAYWKTMSRKCADDNEVMAKQRAEAFKKERHHKYKRCLAMARWCHAMWILLRDENETKRSVYYWRWWNIWLEIADKFKEAK